MRRAVKIGARKGQTYIQAEAIKHLAWHGTVTAAYLQWMCLKDN